MSVCSHDECPPYGCMRTSGKATRARAREGDPSTSVAAARHASRGLSDNQRAVKAVLRVLGRPVLDEELVREYQARFKAMHLPQQSESGIRSRRSELSSSGDLAEGTKERMSTGRLGRTWSIKEEPNG